MFTAGSVDVVGIRVASASLETQASLCGECMAETHATAQCRDCNHWLCTEHASVHPLRRAFAGHVVVSIDPGTWSLQTRRQAQLGGKQTSIPDDGPQCVKCPRHPRVDMESYCEPCMALVCRRCLDTGGHTGAGHEVWPLEDAAEDVVERLEKLFGRFPSETGDVGGDSGTKWKSVSDLLVVEEAISAAITSANDAHHRASEEIGEAFSRLRAVLDKREKVLLDNVDALAWSQLKCLEKQREEVRQATGECRRAVRLVTICSQMQHYSALLNLSQWMTDCGTSSSQFASVTPCLVPGIHVTSDSTVSPQEAINTFCSVSNHGFNPSRATCSARSFINASHDGKDNLKGIQIAVRVFDQYGQLLHTAATDNWSFKFHFIDGGKEYECSAIPPAIVDSEASQNSADSDGAKHDSALRIPALMSQQNRSFKELLSHMGTSQPRDCQTSSPIRCVATKDGRLLSNKRPISFSSIIIVDDSHWGPVYVDALHNGQLVGNKQHVQPDGAFDIRNKDISFIFGPLPVTPTFPITSPSQQSTPGAGPGTRSASDPPFNPTTGSTINPSSKPAALGPTLGSPPQYVPGPAPGLTSGTGPRPGSGPILGPTLGTASWPAPGRRTEPATGSAHGLGATPAGLFSGATPAADVKSLFSTSSVNFADEWAAQSAPIPPASGIFSGASPGPASGIVFGDASTSSLKASGVPGQTNPGLFAASSTAGSTSNSTLIGGVSLSSPTANLISPRKPRSALRRKK